VKDKSVKVDKSENIKADALDEKQIGAPLQGLLSSVLVKRGEAVKKNQPLFIIEAMKMETTVTSNAEGVVKSIQLKGGDLVNPDDLVLTLE
jgi:pyruvate carboxylase